LIIREILPALRRVWLLDGFWNEGGDNKVKTAQPGLAVPQRQGKRRAKNTGLEDPPLHKQREKKERARYIVPLRDDVFAKPCSGHPADVIRERVRYCIEVG